MYALIESDKFIRFVDLRKDYPNTSFPIPITESDLPTGIVTVYKASKPEITDYQVLILDESPKKIDGLWILGYSVTNMSNDQIQDIKNQKASQIRNQRNNLLRDSDWTQLRDVNVDHGAWESYRQKLRDITKQSDFPDRIEWPDKP
jgi:hypothetical protein